MPKDNESIPLFDPGPLVPSEPQAFAPDQMVECEKCSRSNPPTRVNCLYCGTPFSYDEQSAEIRRPSLRPLERWEQGYSNVLDSDRERTCSEQETVEAATLLKLTPEVLRSIFESGHSLPVAHAASLDEAKLIASRLDHLGITTAIVSDADLRLEDSPPLRIRAAGIDETRLIAYRAGVNEPVEVFWPDVVLIVEGRLVIKRIEVRERMVGRRESEIQDTSETYADEAVLDLYQRANKPSLRIAANSFDFSVLGEEKTLLSRDNFSRLLSLLRKHAASARFDDSYRSVRQLIELVWPAEKQTESLGWRRERPGKLTLDAVTATNNELQFTRYSRLRYHQLQSHDSHEIP